MSSLSARASGNMPMNTITLIRLRLVKPFEDSLPAQHGIVHNTTTEGDAACQPSADPSSRASGLNPLPCDLPPIETRKGSHSVLILAPLNLNITRRKEDFNMAGVTLVWVDTTVGAVGAAASFLVRGRGWCKCHESAISMNVRGPAARQCP